MKKETAYIDDLKEIKNLMNQSSRFMSLSGWSGISIGILALVASFVAASMIYPSSSEYLYNDSAIKEIKLRLILIATITVILALFLGYTCTSIKAKKEGKSVINEQSKQLIFNFGLPLLLGGMSVPLLYIKGYILLIAPMMLIVYGLSLINASKFTLKELKSLGVLEIILGLIGIYFPGFGLPLWAVGFGVLHIVYGIIMKVKYP